MQIRCLALGFIPKDLIEKPFALVDSSRVGYNAEGIIKADSLEEIFLCKLPTPEFHRVIAHEIEGIGFAILVFKRLELPEALQAEIECLLMVIKFTVDHAHIHQGNALIELVVRMLCECLYLVIGL